MLDIVVLIYEEETVLMKVDRLQQSDYHQRREVKRIKPRQAKHKERPAADRSIGNRVTVFPEKDEPADAPKHPDAVFAGFVERIKQVVERQLGSDEIGRFVGDEGKVLIVPDQHGECGDETQRLQSQQLVCQRRGRGFAHYGLGLINRLGAGGAQRT